MRSSTLLMGLLVVLMLIGVASAAEQLTKSNFADPAIEGVSSSYYYPGQTLTITYIIKPKTDDDATKLDNRIYKVSTKLTSSKIKAQIMYKDGGIIIKEGAGSLSITVNEWEKGLDSIKLNVEGKVPSVDERVVDESILQIDVSDADSDVLPPVTIKIVNKNRFKEDISQLESKINELTEKADGLENQGVAIATIKKKLNVAKSYLQDGKNYYLDGEFAKADSMLTNAENYLDEVEKELLKAETSYIVASAENKLDDLVKKLSEVEQTILNAKSAGVPVTSYDLKLEKYKAEYNQLYSRIGVAREYVDKGLYEDALNVAKDVSAEVDSIIAKLEAMHQELSTVVKASSTPTPTPTATPEDEGVSLNIDAGVVATYGVVIVGVVVGGAAIYKGGKEFLRRRRWDELK